MFALLLGIGILRILGFVASQPDTELGFALFKSRYTKAEDKSQPLTQLFMNLDGVSTPPRIDHFITERFLLSESAAERTAIVEYYLAQQRRGRPSSNLARLGEPFVERILERLPQLPETDQLAALAMIEGCRRGDAVGKYYFTPIGFAVEKGRLPLDKLINAYRKWWNSGGTWEQKCKRNPTSELELDWSEI